MDGLGYVDTSSLFCWLAIAVKYRGDAECHVNAVKQVWRQNCRGNSSCSSLLFFKMRQSQVIQVTILRDKQNKNQNIEQNQYVM